MPEQIISIVIWTFGEDSLDTAQHSNLRIVLNIYNHDQPSIARTRKLKKDLAMCTLVICSSEDSQSNEPYGLGADELLLSVSAGLRDKLW